MSALILCTLFYVTTSAVPYFQVSVDTTITASLYSNVAGLTIDWNMTNLFNNTIFQTLFQNSLLQQNYQNSFGINMKANSNTGYQCNSTQTYCSVNLTLQNITDVGNFFNNYTNQPFAFAGIAIDHLNLTTLGNFFNDFNGATNGYGFFYVFGQNADTLAARGLRNTSYDINSYLAQAQSFVNVSKPLALIGPAVSINSKSWINNMSLAFNTTSNWSSLFVFSVKMNYFQNDTDCTISNLLSNSYFNKRYTDAFNNVTQQLIYSDYVVISHMKIHYLSGINTITNSFAAALWALDWILNFVQAGGVSVGFDINMTDFQSPYTSSDNFNTTININPTYYAMMFYTLGIKDMGGFCNPSILNNLLGLNVKVYCLTDGSAVRLILINKDMNSSINGYIQLYGPSGLNSITYYYMQANSVLATNNITITGYTYDGTTDGTPRSNSTQGIFFNQTSASNLFTIPFYYSSAIIVEFATNQAFMSQSDYDAVQLDSQSLNLLVLIIILIFSI